MLLQKRNRLSFNIHARGVRDWQKLLTWHNVYKPAWSLVMGDVAKTLAIKSASPETNVIIRFREEWDDDRAHEIFQPKAWVAEVVKRAGNYVNDLWFYTNNESGVSEALVNWLLAVMDESAKYRLRLCLLNPSAGSYEERDLKTLYPLFQRMAQEPERFILGLHEYFCGVITSGFIGGAPDDQRHTNFIPINNWPDSIDLPHVTTFHCGRYRWIQNYCEQRGLSPLRIVITEHGADALRDIDAWRNSLVRTAPYTEIKGVKSLREQWRIWYKNVSNIDSLAAMYIQQLAYADEVIYDESVEGQLIYCHGHTDQQWEQYDTQDESMPEYLLAYQKATSALPPDKPIPPLVTAPANKGSSVNVTVQGAAYYNLRTKPSVEGIIIGRVQPGESLMLYPATAAVEGINTFYFVERDNAPANEQKQGYMVFDYTPPPVTPKPPDNEALKANLLTIRNGLQQSIWQAEAALRDLNNVLDSIE